MPLLFSTASRCELDSLLAFNCPDITAHIISIWPWQATLVDGQLISEWVRAAHRIAGIDSGAAGQSQHRLGWPAVVLQRTEVGIHSRPVRA